MTRNICAFVEKFSKRLECRSVAFYRLKFFAQHFCVKRLIRCSITETFVLENRQNYDMKQNDPLNINLFLHAFIDCVHCAFFCSHNLFTELSISTITWPTLASIHETLHYFPAKNHCGFMLESMFTCGLFSDSC